MKKIVLILFLVLSGFLLKSQISKGTKMIGTRVNYNQSKQDNQSSNGDYKSLLSGRNFNLSLFGGYFIKDNFVAGLNFGYSDQYTESTTKQIAYPSGSSYESNEESDSKIYSAGVYFRLYKMFSENKVGFFGNLNALYSFGNSTSHRTDFANGVMNNDNVSTGDITEYSITLSPGVVYFITKQIGLEASFGNLSFKSQTNETNASSGLTSTYNYNILNFNFSASTFNLGINFYFGGKKN